MRYGDVCTGIDAPTVAWSPLGWKPVWLSEIEPFPCKLLKHHYPDVPNLGNMLSITENPIFKNESIDLLVGGTPCQSFSVAGLRGGLSDERGNLALEFCRILIQKRPRWFLWENVPGVLSSKSDGRSDFATILSAFRECGYSCAWRVLDAQYIGVPQRRRRIFVVGYIGNDWRPPATVLFERQGLYGNIKAGGKKKKEIAGTLDARVKGGGFPGSDGAMNGHVIPVNTMIMNGRPSDNGRMGLGIGDVNDPSYTLTKWHSHAVFTIPCWWDGGQISQTLDRVLSKGQTMPEKNRFPAVLAYPYNQITSKENKSNPKPGDPSPSLTKAGKILLIPNVRRLTPLECERLQGFPDNYTLIPGASDTARYQAIGNSMAVPVMHWIGKRIDLVDKFLQAQ